MTAESIEQENQNKGKTQTSARYYSRLLLLLLGIVGFGAAGSVLVALLKAPSYQAEAAVVVYEMPPEFRSLIGPDLANQIESAYRAGALQDAVVNRVLPNFSGLTASELRARVSVSIIAYTPLTRVIASAPTAQQAVALANGVATAWASVAAHTNNTAYTIVYDQITSREQAIDKQITNTQQQIAAAGAATPVNQTYMNSLQLQLQSELNGKTNAENTLNQLETYRLQVIGNGYVATPASLQNVVRSPSLIKTALTGAAISFALAVVLILLLVRPSVIRQQREAAQKAQPSQQPAAEEWI